MAGYTGLCLLDVLRTCAVVLGMLVVQTTSNVKKGAPSLVDEQTRLLDTLLSNYDKRVPPKVNASQPVNWYMTIILRSLVDLHEQGETLEMFLYLEQVWKDYRLEWEPSVYQKIHHIKVPSESVWQPDVSLFNNVDVDIEKMESLAVVFSDGSVFYSPTVRFRSHCTLDLTHFPFDQQSCAVKLGSYMYDSTDLNLTIGQFKTDDTFISKEWQISDVSSEIKTKYYDCCPEGFQHAQYSFQLQRQSVYYTYVFVLPAVILALLVPFQFLLPPDCKERLTVGCTLLLGCIVLILMIQSYLPDAHQNLPYIVQYYCLTLVWIACSLIGSMLIINTQNKGPRKRRVPVIIRQIFLKTLRKLVCMHEEDAYCPLGDTEAISLRTLEKQQLLSSATADPLKQHDKLERDVDEILRHVTALVHVVSASRGNAQNEWYQVTLVFDRIMCFLFSLIFVIYTCVLLG